MNSESSMANAPSLPVLQTNFPFSQQLTAASTAIAASNAAGSTSNAKNAPFKWKAAVTRQLGDTHALQDFQIECLTNWLNEEVHSHNNTRARATHLNTTALRYERDLCHEQTTVRSLNNTIQNLRERIEQEVDLRLQAERALEAYHEKVSSKIGGERVRQVHGQHSHYDQRSSATRTLSKQEGSAEYLEEQHAMSDGAGPGESRGKSTQRGCYTE